MKQAWLAMGAIMLALAAPLASAQIADINAAINKAGRQRMLSQRLAKAYLQLGQQVDAERSRKVMDASVALFDRQLVELKNFAPTPEIRETYQKLEKAWLAYKDVLVGAAPSPEGGRKVMAINEEVLALAQQGTLQLEKQAGSTAGRLVNLAGRQRMLSQRLAKFYQAAAWGIAPTGAANELEKSRREFAEALNELASAPANTAQIRDGLELVRQQWLFFDAAVVQRAAIDKRQSLAVATTSERILEEMETVVALYERLGTK